MIKHDIVIILSTIAIMLLIHFLAKATAKWTIIILSIYIVLVFQFLLMLILI
jgi:hypothetical protein